jgi:AraC family transcriptional regulator, positive regulator of tynA and feaB
MAAGETTFTLDTRTVKGAGLTGSLREWQDFLGERALAPEYDPATMADLRIRFRQARVGEAIVHSHEGFSPVRAGKPEGVDGAVSLILVRRGSATIEAPRDTYAIAPGSFLTRRIDRPVSFTNGPLTAGMSITLPGAGIAPLLGDRVVQGGAQSAEMRLLTAYAGLLHRTAPELSPAGARAACDALVELATAVVRGAGGVDSLTAPALVEAARQLADRRLTERDLGPAMLARELHVSTRTLQRAFTASGESVTSYVRRRRLERARRDLAEPAAVRLTVAEIAARWQFGDGGHFGRAFKRHYKITPIAYARSIADPELTRRRRPGG